MEIVEKSENEAVNAEANLTIKPENSPSLDVLNDDSLLHIFNYVKNARDLMAVEKVCKRWQRICSLTWKNVIIREPEVDDHLEEILKKCGDRVISLDIFSNHYFEDDVFKIINLHCKKLCSLDVALHGFFDSTDLNVHKYPFLKNLSSLKVLELEDFFSKPADLFRDLSNFLQNVSQLKELAVSDCNGRSFGFKDNRKRVEVNYLKFPEKNQTDQFFNNLFPELIDLKVSFREVNECDEDLSFYDYFVNVADWVTSIEIVKSAHDSCFRGVKYKTLQFSNLKKLLIEESPSVSDDVIFTLVRICPVLEDIDFYDNENITDFGFKFLGNSKVLRKLSLRSCEVTTSTLEFLAENVKTLEELHLPCGPELSDTELINIVNFLPNLRFIRLTNIYNMSEESFKLILEKVMERHANRCLEIEFVDATTDDAEEFNLKEEKNLSLESADGLVVSLFDLDAEEDVKKFNEWAGRLNFYDGAFPHTRKNFAKYYRCFTVEK